MILTYQAHKCSPEGICFTFTEYILLIKVWTCGPVLWSVGWGVSRRYCRSCFELCTYCNILDIYLSWNMNSVKYLFYMELLNYLFCDMFGGILECYELTHVLHYPDPTRQSCMSGQALLPHWLCNQKHPWGICSCSPIVNFLKVTFYHGMVTLVIFPIKKII